MRTEMDFINDKKKDKKIPKSEAISRPMAYLQLWEASFVYFYNNFIN